MDPMIRISRARKNIGPVVMALLVIHLFSEARPETEETKKRFAGSGSSMDPAMSTTKTPLKYITINIFRTVMFSPHRENLTDILQSPGSEILDLLP